MTVRELIKELLDCNLDSEVTIEIKSEHCDLFNTYTVVDKFSVLDYIGGVVIEEASE